MNKCAGWFDVHQSTGSTIASTTLSAPSNIIGDSYTTHTRACWLKMVIKRYFMFISPCFWLMMNISSWPPSNKLLRIRGTVTNSKWTPVTRNKARQTLITCWSPFQVCKPSCEWSLSLQYVFVLHPNHLKTIGSMLAVAKLNSWLSIATA